MGEIGEMPKILAVPPVHLPIERHAARTWSKIARLRHLFGRVAVAKLHRYIHQLHRHDEIGKFGAPQQSGRVRPGHGKKEAIIQNLAITVDNLKKENRILKMEIRSNNTKHADALADLIASKKQGTIAEFIRIHQN